MSLANNLDRPDAMLQLTKHTNACKAAFNSKALWETYGIVEWVSEHLEREHGRAKADSILDEIDRR